MEKQEMITKARNLFKRNKRIVRVVFYAGFVANSYKWPCPRWGFSLEKGQRKLRAFSYDAKRPHGIGPDWVAFSEKGGRLASA